MAAEKSSTTDNHVECTLDDRCDFCTGEACALCGAGLTQSGQPNSEPCEHDVIERHTHGHNADAPRTHSRPLITSRHTRMSPVVTRVELLGSLLRNYMD